MSNQLLRDSGWASMAHSLEIRTPLVDVKLFKTVVGLIDQGYEVGKNDMAMTPCDALPNELMNRKKTRFTIPVHQWLVENQIGEHHPHGRGYRDWSAHAYNSAIGVNR